MYILIVIILVGVACGIFLVTQLNYMARRRWLKEIEDEGREYIDQALQNSEEYLADLQRQLEEEKSIAFEQFESESQAALDENKEREFLFQEKKVALEEQVDEREALLREQQAQVDRYEGQVKRKQDRFSHLKKRRKDLQARYEQNLKEAFSLEAGEIQEFLKRGIQDESQTSLQKQLQLQEELAQQNAERQAQAIIHIALNRFARAYCPEKGANYVNLVDEERRDRVFGPDRSHLRKLEELCGVDLIYREDMNSVSVSGFDPVRREWARACLKEMLACKKPLSGKFIEKTTYEIKRRLLKRIKRDGKKLFRELRLEGVHPEIVHMMGALRYRYSFAQNQYFHCSEVGFLCGLMAAELGLPISEARRMGVLHDIGKAMDHSIDGGHAVIGADFIAKHGESESVVHAVRAHHYDEEPRTDLAFLVIAADALSGARPGARRSTADAYMQKMGQLQEIGNSFEETKDTFIMSAGREVRIKVDSKKVSDRDLIDLSKKVTQKIEEECSYPGLIKVTIVRQTHAVEYARKAGHTDNGGGKLQSG